MKLIVTGGAGRLGEHLIQDLLNHGHEVIAIDTMKPETAPWQFVGADLTRMEAWPKVFHAVDAVAHLARKRFPYTESGFNPRTQRWEMTDVIGDAERFNGNVAMTYNVLAAAQASGVGKVVCGSSLAVYGLYYGIRDTSPDYLPIDELHPLRPQDPYGMSKLVGEQICEAFAPKSDIQIASLRFSGIYTDAHVRLLLERKRNPTIRGTGALWSYIDVRDAARACRMALEANFRGHEAFNICAPTTIMNTPTRELVHRYLPQVKRVRDGLEGNWCGCDTSKAAASLGFRAHHLFRNGSLG